MAWLVKENIKFWVDFQNVLPIFLLDLHCENLVKFPEEKSVHHSPPPPQWKEDFRVSCNSPVTCSVCCHQYWLQLSGSAPGLPLPASCHLWVCLFVCFWGRAFVLKLNSLMDLKGVVSFSLLSFFLVVRTSKLFTCWAGNRKSSK